MTHFPLIIFVTIMFSNVLEAQVRDDLGEYESVVFLSMEHQPIVEGAINGKTAYFLLDTSSDISVIHKPDAGTCYQQASELTEKLLGVATNAMQIQRLTTAYGEQVSQLLTQPTPAEAVEEAEVMYAQVDGGMLLTRE